MRLELTAGGYDVHFLAVNKIAAESTQDKLSARCAYPLLQDTVDANVWELHDGKKDDFYIYRSDGTLAAYLPNAGPTSINLSTDAGYAFVKDSILAVLEAE